MSTLESNHGTVLIAGAGIGGLSLGCALQHAGIAFEIFERAPSLGTVGAGIVIQTAAMLALRHLGLDEAVARAGHETKRGTGKNAAGVVLHSTRLDEFGAPSIAIHRARLQATLLGALPSARVHAGREVVGYEQDEHGVQALFSDGSRASGQLLIGADGLHSATRRQLLGDTPLRYSGYTSWRGVAPMAPSTPAHEVFEIWGRGLRFGIVPIADAETYWFAVANAAEGGTEADRAMLVQRFASFGEPARALLEATPPERIVRTDIKDRKPVSSWTQGRVSLLGDAAHPTTPNLGQGGCMAIEDAVVLAHCLGKHTAYADAFAAYERKRVEHTTKIVNASFQFGRIAQLEGGFTTWLRDLALRATPDAQIRARLRDNAQFSLD
ncbi:MAG TPA: FAD-dependent monooxygenase [Polyangiaceae bacterium]|nr:FAD-dependent monooxygenase [Polyangiaceae bacterium]